MPRDSFEKRSFGKAQREIANQRTKVVNVLKPSRLDTMASSSLWQRFQRYFLEDRELGFSLDISRMKFPEDLFEKMRPQIEHAFMAMRDLEAGAIANPTENRMVGQSMPTQRRRFTCCGIWRATIPGSQSCLGRKLWMTGFHSEERRN